MQKKSKFENFESALYSTSVSMPLIQEALILQLKYYEFRFFPPHFQIHCLKIVIQYIIMKGDQFIYKFAMLL